MDEPTLSADDMRRRITELEDTCRAVKRDLETMTPATKPLEDGGIECEDLRPMLRVLNRLEAVLEAEIQRVEPARVSGFEIEVDGGKVAEFEGVKVAEGDFHEFYEWAEKGEPPESVRVAGVELGHLVHRDMKPFNIVQIAGVGLTPIKSAAEFIAAVRRCDDCDPSFGCWDGKSEPCRKAPLPPVRRFTAWCDGDSKEVELRGTDEQVAAHMDKFVTDWIERGGHAGWKELKDG